MATPDLLDFDQLLNPISADAPSGEDLKHGSVHAEIMTARKQGSRDLLDDGTVETPPNWSLIVELATTAIATRSKDLLVGAWLTEALIGQHGFAGGRDGFKLLNELLERFWDTVFPQIRDGDVDFRLAPLNGCTEPGRGGKLIVALREAPLLIRLVNGKSEKIFSLNDWESCFLVKRGTTLDRQPEPEESFAARKELAAKRKQDYQDALNAASRETIQDLVDDLQGVRSEISRFGDILQQRFDRKAPAVSPLREALEGSIDIAERTLKEKGGTNSAPDGNTNLAQQANSAGLQNGSGLSAGAIHSRQEAFNRLEEIAKYLRQVEPHSPVSYLVQRAVNWGRMPFEDLLEELLKDTSVRAQVGELLGIKPSN